MSGGNWSVLGLTGDPVRGDPGAVRTLANASQQEARRWEEQVRTLRTIANEGDAMDMEGDFVPAARQGLRAHPDDATPLARGRADAGAALLSYAGQLEQLKRESQMALRDGTQAKRNFDMAKRRYDQAVARMNAMPKVVPPQMLAAAQAQFNALRAEAQAAWQAMQQADMALKAAQRRALQAGERATAQERMTAERVSAAASAAVRSNASQ